MMDINSVDLEPYFGVFLSLKLKYLYGGGVQSAVVCAILRDLKLDIDGVVLPPGGGIQEMSGFWRRMIRKEKVLSFSDFLNRSDKSCGVLLTCDRDEYGVVRCLLSSYGFNNVYECKWNHNSDLQNIVWNMINMEDTDVPR